MDHFPKRLRSLPPFEGAFDAFKLEAKDCDVLFASYHVGARVQHAARFEVETSEIEFWFYRK